MRRSLSKEYSIFGKMASSGYLCLFLKNLGITFAKCLSPMSHIASASVTKSLLVRSDVSLECLGGPSALGLDDLIGETSNIEFGGCPNSEGMRFVTLCG